MDYVNIVFVALLVVLASTSRPRAHAVGVIAAWALALASAVVRWVFQAG